MGMLKVMIMPYVACSRLDRKVSSLSLGLWELVSCKNEMGLRLEEVGAQTAKLVCVCVEIQVKDV